MPEFLRRAWEWVRTLPNLQKALLGAAGVVVLVVASRAVAAIAALVFIVAIVAFIVQLLRRAPARSWALAAGGAFVAVLLFGGIADAVYGPATIEDQPRVKEPVKEPPEEEEPMVEEEPVVEEEPPEEEEPEPVAEPEEATPSPQPVAPRPSAGTGSSVPWGSECPDDFPIKGNINERRERIYHVPGGQFYAKTDAERCFVTESDAIEAGFRPSQR